MQERLVLVQKNHVVGIPEIIFDTDLLFYPMVKVCEEQVGEILRQVIAIGTPAALSMIGRVEPACPGI